jgi:hypothetical protein
MGFSMTAMVEKWLICQNEEPTRFGKFQGGG